MKNIHISKQVSFIDASFGGFMVCTEDFEEINIKTYFP